MVYAPRVAYLRMAATLSGLALLYKPTSSLPCVTKTENPHYPLLYKPRHATKVTLSLIPVPHKTSPSKRFLTGMPSTLRVQKSAHSSKTECSSYRPRLSTCEVDAAHSKPAPADSWPSTTPRVHPQSVAIVGRGWVKMDFPLTAV